MLLEDSEKLFDRFCAFHLIVTQPYIHRPFSHFFLSNNKGFTLPSYIGELKTVPADHEPENVECGFYGIPSRAYRNQFGMAEYARVELP